MAWIRGRRVLWAASLGFLTWGVVEARTLDWTFLTQPSRGHAPVSDPQVVEQSFAELRSALAAGRTEQALLSLRRRAEHGPYPGFSRFWLGELAFAEGAHGAAVRQYRLAVEADPGVADRNTAFDAGVVIDARLTAILEGPWARQRPPEIRDLYYLRRRLGGGCE